MKRISETKEIPVSWGKMKVILLRPAEKQEGPGILWIHGGGYMLGMKEMVYASAGKMLAEKYGGVVVSPGYRLAFEAPYPAALEDCYAALCWMNEHREELGITKLIVGGESAGGGLTAALCLYARDQGEIKVDFQLPLYPMLDCQDTHSSKDNHGKVWNTRRNHWGWKHYLGDLYGSEEIPVYASAARASDLQGLPPCYTFVSEGEPFLYETLTYVQKLQDAGVKAAVDVYPGDVHAFDLLTPYTKTARAARKKLCEVYEEEVINV